MKEKLIVYGLYLGEKGMLSANSFIIGNLVLPMRKTQKIDFEKLRKVVFDCILESNKGKDVIDEMCIENLEILNIIDI